MLGGGWYFYTLDQPLRAAFATKFRIVARTCHSSMIPMQVRGRTASPPRVMRQFRRAVPVPPPDARVSAGGAHSHLPVFDLPSAGLSRSVDSHSRLHLSAAHHD